MDGSAAAGDAEPIADAATAAMKSARGHMLLKPPDLVMFLFGDVARFVDGSVNAGAVSYMGNCENCRGRFVAAPISSRRSSSSASATTIDGNGPPAPEPQWVSVVH